MPGARSSPQIVVWKVGFGWLFGRPLFPRGGLGLLSPFPALVLASLGISPPSGVIPPEFLF